MAAMPAIARADATCDATHAQDLARQGYSYLNSHRWQDAHSAAIQLEYYGKDCNNPKVGYPSLVHSTYILAAALHGLGDDVHAADAWRFGMNILSALKKDGWQASLYDAMRPRFIELQPRIPGASL